MSEKPAQPAADQKSNDSAIRGAEAKEILLKAAKKAGGRNVVVPREALIEALKS